MQAFAQVTSSAVDTPAPLKNFLASKELARIQTIPAADNGVQDIHWVALSPPGWQPQQVLTPIPLGDMQDDDPRAKKIMASIQAEWDKAPAVSTLPEGLVRIYGFPVMPKNKAKTTRKIILAPYYGSCMHSPPPPANQRIAVTLASAIPTSMFQFPIWVVGHLVVRTQKIDGVQVAYAMDTATWQAYDYLKYPMRPYRLPF
jgi:hypothetical protein